MNTEQTPDFVWDTHEIARTQARWLVESRKRWTPSVGQRLDEDKCFPPR